MDTEHSCLHAVSSSWQRSLQRQETGRAPDASVGEEFALHPLAFAQDERGEISMPFVLEFFTEELNAGCDRAKASFMEHVPFDDFDDVLLPAGSHNTHLYSGSHLPKRAVYNVRFLLRILNGCIPVGISRPWRND